MNFNQIEGVQIQLTSKAKKNFGTLSWIQFAILGIGFTTGTGFFLGMSIAMEKAGFAVLFTCLLAAIGTSIVFEALAKLYLHHPDPGSFRTYGKQAFGKWAGFSIGWIYWGSELLILGSTLTALGIFTQYWLPATPLWILSSIYAIVGIGIVGLGVQRFQRVENVLSVVKIFAILLFILVALLIFFRIIGEFEPVNHQNHNFLSISTFLRPGAIHLMTSLLFSFYAFGGIEVLGLMAPNLKYPKTILKSGKLMIISLTGLYMISILLALLLIRPKDLSTSESPFVIALRPHHMEILIDVFNGIFIIAGFSVLVASLYSVTIMITALAKDGDAPRLFYPKSDQIPLAALSLTAFCLFISLALTYLLPRYIYEHLTTAGGLMLLYTWVSILLSYRRLLHVNRIENSKTIIGLCLIGLAILGTLFDPSSQIGFWISIGFLSAIGLISWIRFRNRDEVKLKI